MSFENWTPIIDGEFTCLSWMPGDGKEVDRMTDWLTGYNTPFYLSSAPGSHYVQLNVVTEPRVIDLMPGDRLARIGSRWMRFVDNELDRYFTKVPTGE